jgi:hypothetical protein
VLGAAGQICPRRSGPNQVPGALDALDSDDIGESFIDPSCVSSQSGRAIHAAANSQVFTCNSEESGRGLNPLTRQRGRARPAGLLLAPEGGRIPGHQ